MVSYLSAIWNCRFFWLSLVKNDLRTRYRGSIIGIGWSLLQPIAMTCIICIVVPNMFGPTPGGNPWAFAPYVLAGLACWNYLTQVTLQGCRCFFSGESYIRQYPAPLAIYPLRTALGCMIHFLFAFAVVLALVTWVHGFPGFRLLSLVPTIALLFVFGWAMAVLAGFANVYFQDTQHLAEVGFQIAYFATPIMYYIEIFSKRPRVQFVLHCNPVVPFLQLIREPLMPNPYQQMEAHLPSLPSYAAAIGIVLLVCGLASLVLSKLQKRLIFHL